MHSLFFMRPSDTYSLRARLTIQQASASIAIIRFPSRSRMKPPFGLKASLMTKYKISDCLNKSMMALPGTPFKPISLTPQLNRRMQRLSFNGELIIESTTRLSSRCRFIRATPICISIAMPCPGNWILINGNPLILRARG